MDGEDCICLRSSRQLSRTIQPATSEWVCLDLYGKPVRKLLVPPGLELTALRGNSIWAFSETEDGVPVVVRLEGKAS